MKSHSLKFILFLPIFDVFLFSSYIILAQDDADADVLSFEVAATVAAGEITTIDLTFEIPETDCPALSPQDQIDVVLVMDVSGSMQGTRLAVAKSAALRFLAQLSPDTTQVGLVRFASRATALNNLTSDYIPVDDNINDLIAGGNTNIAAGLQQAALLLNRNARPDSRRIILVLSDGESNIGDEVATAGQIREQGIEIFAVGFGDASQTDLREVASDGNFFVFSETNQGLNAAFIQAGQGIASGNLVAGSNIIIELNVDTENFEVVSELVLDGSVDNDGTISWTIPVIYDGQSIQRSLVIVPLNEGTFSLGDAEIIYDACLGGDPVSIELEETLTLEVVEELSEEEFIASGVLAVDTEATGELDVLDTDRWLLELEDVSLISVVITGAGSELVPDVLVNEELVITPLYSVRDVETDTRTSVYFVGDIDAAWLYVQSNSREDIGIYVIDISDSPDGNATLLALDGDNVIETQSEFEGRIYDLQGRLSEGDYVTVIYDFGNVPAVDIVSLSDGVKAQPQTGWYLDFDTIAYSFQLRGEGPYRMVVTTDTQYRVAVQSGDTLQTQRGELEVNNPTPSSGSDLEMDRWTIELEAGQPYIISVPGAAGRGVYFELYLQGDDTLRYIADSFWNGGYHDEIGPFVLPESGTYSLIVAAGRDYQVEVRETTLEQTEPQPIFPGQSVSGETIAGTDGLQWTFDGQENQFVTLVLDPSRADVSWVEMSLATEDGVDVAFSDDDGALVTIGPVLLTEDTTYVITVAPRFFINSNFDLTLSVVDVSNATEIQSGRSANLRGGPGTNFAVVGGVEANETLLAIGAVEAGDWIYVVTLDGSDGWLFAQTLDDPDSVVELAVVDSNGNVIIDAPESSDDGSEDDDNEETSDDEEDDSDEDTEIELSCTVSPSQNANLRSGPGTGFDRAGTLSANESATVVAQATGSGGFTWWQLESGNWIREDVVTESGNCEDAPEN
mgnify:FL=1